MGFFNLIESFFFLSLGITFVLIFLIVFYFKQRLEKLEKNNQALGDICNEIIKELSTLKSICVSNIISPTSHPPPMRNMYNPLPPNPFSLQGGNYSQSQSQQSQPSSIPSPTSSSGDFKKIIVLNNVVEMESEDEEDNQNSDADSESSYEQEGEEEEYGLDSDIEIEENIKFEVIDHGIDYEKMRILQNESHIVFSSNRVSELVDESLLEVIEEEEPKVKEVISEEDLEEEKTKEVFVEMQERISSDGFTILSDKKPEPSEDSLKDATKECLDEILDSVEIIQNDVIAEEKVCDVSMSTVTNMREEFEEDMKKIPVDTRNYKKMNVEELKSLVVSKGLVTDASKLKKNDLIRLLTQ